MISGVLTSVPTFYVVHLSHSSPLFKKCKKNCGFSYYLIEYIIKLSWKNNRKHTIRLFLKKKKRKRLFILYLNLL